MAKATRGWYRQSWFYRKVVQGLVFLFMLNVYIRHVVFFDANVEAYCPFGGLETLYSYFTKGTLLSPIEPLNLAIFITIVILTLVFRGGFCGWVCPIGTAQEILRAIGVKIGEVSFLRAVNKKYHLLICKNKSILVKIDLWARSFKYLALMVIVISTWVAADLVIRDYDLIVALIKIQAPMISFGFIILALTIVLSFFIGRPFCKYFCVMGAVINLIGKLSPLRIVRNDAACTDCTMCTRVCPMKLHIADSGRIDALDCNHCFRCIDACPVDGGLYLQYFPKGLYSFNKKSSDRKVNSDKRKILKTDMHKGSHFRYYYGFVILIFIATAVITVNTNENVAAFLGQREVAVSSSSWEVDGVDIRGKGLPAPRGNFSFGQIIAAYELDKEEFYTALGLPMDYPETEIVREAITQKKATTMKKVMTYMRPIVDGFEAKTTWIPLIDE